MEEINGNQRVYNVSEIKGLMNLSSDNRKTYIHYIKLYIVASTCHICATQAPARCPLARVMENYFKNMNTRVLMEPILLLLLLLLLFLLIYQFDKVSIP